MNPRNGYATVPVTALEPAPYNPNRLTDKQFTQLVDEVRRQRRVLKPVVVRKANGVAGRYVIVDGEHTWRAAKEAGLAEVPVDVISDDGRILEVEARRQTFVRNKVGKHHMKLGRMLVEMQHGTASYPSLEEQASRLATAMSQRQLAGLLGISEGTVRNLMLYARAADLCAGREGMPSEDEIAAMGVREVRKLIAQLEGNGGEEGEDLAGPKAPPKDAADEPSELRLLKHHWNRASEEIRAAFLAWVGPAPAPTALPIGSTDRYAPESGPTPARNRYAPASPEAHRLERRPFGIDAKEFAALCEAAGTTMKAFAEKEFATTPSAMARLMNGTATPYPAHRSRMPEAIAELRERAKQRAGGSDEPPPKKRRKGGGSFEILDVQPADAASPDDNAWRDLTKSIHAELGGSLTATALALSEALGIDETSLCRVFLGHKASEVSLTNDDFAKVRDRWREVLRNRYAAKPAEMARPQGRQPDPPKVVIPEIETLLASGQTLAEISTGIGGALNSASLLRGGHKKLSQRMQARLVAYAEANGVEVRHEQARQL